MVYDITDPTAPSFLSYEPAATGDVGPEASVFINASQSPSGNPLLVVAHETSSTLAIYEIATDIGVQESVFSGETHPYPNPSKSIVTIKFSSIIKSEYSLYSIFGTLLESKNFHGSEVQVNASHLTQGTYLLKVNESTHKILKSD